MVVVVEASVIVGATVTTETGTRGERTAETVSCGTRRKTNTKILTEQWVVEMFAERLFG